MLALEYSNAGGWWLTIQSVDFESYYGYEFPVTFVFESGLVRTLYAMTDEFDPGMAYIELGFDPAFVEAFQRSGWLDVDIAGGEVWEAGMRGTSAAARELVACANRWGF